uniref:Leucine rich repeat containing 9 n=1 Tax=Oreochromis niloticus TaxID=8128 RepID=A0A669EAH4_ORENI
MLSNEKQKNRSEEEVIKKLCMANGVPYEKIAQEGSSITSLEMFFSGFPRMVGLSFFPRLCQLTIIGQNIEHIDGLECCPLLQELWIVQCHLTEISGLQNCLQLEKLYLYENKISEIKNLDLQVHLEVLWINNNCITKIKVRAVSPCLDPNVNLQKLNLSGNKISSFKELSHLARLPRLSELALKDPTSTPNPVCLLCNYETHILYHVPSLQRLDIYDVSSKQIKDAAESAVMKKMMYYNMRVRTAQRKLAETRLSLIERKKTLSQSPEECIKTLTRALKFVRTLHKMSFCSRLTERNESISDIICIFHEIQRQCIIYTVQFLLMELESVGNIRLEEGCSTDPWFTSCCDLLLSRFSPSDYKTYGITDIRVDRVICIHNSALRLCFEDKIHSLLASEDLSSQNYRRQLEYLFYVVDPEKCEKDETLQILQEGFKTTEQQKANGKEGAIPFSNSLSVSERSRIEYALRQTSQGCTKHSMDTMPFRHGQVIVSKVFVGKSMPIRDGEPVDRSNYPGVYSVYRSVETNPRRRQWFVFDRELVLPEYIIYYEYITQVNYRVHSFDCEPPPQSQVFYPSNDVALDKEVLNREPVLKPQPKLLSLDDKILLSVARANVLSQITVLNLHGNSLSNIKEISSLTALRHLTVSFNEFTHLDDISHMPNLEVLDASFNHLVTLEGLRGLGELKQLDVRWNKLTKVREDTAVLRKHTPALLKLDTRYNPWNRPEAVRMTILGHLTNLTHLDDVLVAEEEAAEAVQMAAGSKINQLQHVGFSVKRFLGAVLGGMMLIFVTFRVYQIADQITTLNLDNQRISKMISLSKLVNLRWASFNDNEISKVEGLDNCLKLEELSLNNNNICTLSGLTRLHCLNRLSVDGNRLTSLDVSTLDGLSSLSFLSAENNCIASLHGIQRLRSLLELYIGSNQISTSRDIYCLKGLTNLIILDLCGNPLVEKLENYRIYVVFHLPFLKALDGIEASECESAKNMFMGRLTSDTVAEKLGHSNYTEITHLNLQACSIRIVDLSPPDLFRNVRCVNLDHSNLTSFSGLIHLPNIKALCLNYNHIESILPRQKTQTHLTSRQILYSKVCSSGYSQQSTSKASRDTGPTGSLEPLMGSLEVLHLSHNGISNMANLQLSRLTNLKALFLEGNEITQVEGLEGLRQLRELVLNRNRIKTLTKNSFAAQALLLELHLAQNRIRELNHLDPLIELCKLSLDMNKLQDIAELDKLEALPSLKELSVVGNPVSINKFYRQFVH